MLISCWVNDEFVMWAFLFVSGYVCLEVFNYIEDYKESWAPKNWCFLTVVLEKTLESPLDCKEIQPVYPKGNQSWIFIGKTDAEALILWPSDVTSWLIGKDPAGEERGDRWQDGWLASLTQWTWVWASSRRWWRAGKPGVLQSMDMTEQLTREGKVRRLKRSRDKYTYWLWPSKVHHLAR